VFFGPSGTGVTAPELARRMQARGVQLSVLGGRVRACTHLDVTSAMIDEALALLRAPSLRKAEPESLVHGYRARRPLSLRTEDRRPSACPAKAG
jgi:hypothetical protein